MPTVFITGTDTGVGKTVVTGLLLRHLRAAGLEAVAFKPFATGDRADARWLNALQKPAALSLTQVNPFLFRSPVAPLAAARNEHRTVPLAEARAALSAVRRRCDILLVEGCGGLLVPLGPDYTLLDLMPPRHARVVVVAANRLGVINHTRLTVQALAHRPGIRIHVVLADATPATRRDPSRATNLAMLRELLAPVPVDPVPFLGKQPGTSASRHSRPHAVSTTLAALARAFRLLTPGSNAADRPGRTARTSGSRPARYTAVPPPRTPASRPP